MLCILAQIATSQSCYSLNTRLAKKGQDGRAAHKEEHHRYGYLTSTPSVTELETDARTVHPQIISSSCRGEPATRRNNLFSLPAQRTIDLVVVTWFMFCLLLRVLNMNSAGAAGVSCSR